MPGYAPLIGLALAGALVGCGSTSSGPGSTGSADLAIQRTHSAKVKIAVPATPSPTTASASTTSTSTGPATAGAPPASTTPRSLPTPKRHTGPRKLSVAEDASPIHTSGGRSPAQQLVEKWRGGAVAASDPNVAQVQRHLASLDRKCTEPEASIAGYVRAGIERYRTHGVLESPVEFSRALDSATPPGRSNCKGILRTLLAQVEQG